MPAEPAFRLEASTADGIACVAVERSIQIFAVASCGCCAESSNHR